MPQTLEEIPTFAVEGDDARLSALRHLLDLLVHRDADAQINDVDAVGRWLADVALNGRQPHAEAATEDLTRLSVYWNAVVREGGPTGTAVDQWSFVRGQLHAYRILSEVIADRLPHSDEIQRVARGSVAHEVLQALTASELQTTNEVAAATGRGPSEISRTGKALEASRMVVRDRNGRNTLWQITPRGRDALEQLDAGGAPGRQRTRKPKSGGPSHDVQEVKAVSQLLEPAEMSIRSLRSALREEPDARSQSRALMACSLHHGEAVRARLEMWSALPQCQPRRSVFIMSDLSASEERVGEATVGVLNHVASLGNIHEAWPLPIPSFDAYALLPGKVGVVLMTAKSQTQQLNAAPWSSSKRPRNLGLVLDEAASNIGASAPWGQLRSYREPAVRAAFVQRLRDAQVPVWWLSVYFAQRWTDGRSAHHDVSSWEHWQDELLAMENRLHLVQPNIFKDYAQHAILPVPALP